MQDNQTRKKASGAVIHTAIHNHPYLNIPMIMNQNDGQIYDVFSVGFHSNDTIAIVTTDGFSTNRVNTPIITVKNNDGSFQAYRLPLELEYWVISCMHAASAGKNPFPCKVTFGIIDTKYHVEFK
ncbi:hypothetical protein CBR59_28760 [Bacillus thuringiensis]|uniref:hypothetical protein n=1 Tax=Bacillus thuringiensis TaxID=1428 RepID=UPI000C9E77F2|nr:hypothetical protein [Bacillus thuringiensis]PNK23168.1 hypothetical protein CBP87_29220 [Bacillus thuringiensis]PNK47629.1 hypothetical protein CBR59_28760 [Bacillus thuringiensis]